MKEISTKPEVFDYTKENPNGVLLEKFCFGQQKNYFATLVKLGVKAEQSAPAVDPLAA